MSRRARLQAALDEGSAPIVAGFQGVDDEGNITTIGRGGSDTTAVALAVALKADECQILTDVDGVYTTDPRVVADARRLDRLSFEEMLELAGQGSRVLHLRCVEFAAKYNVPLRVLSSFGSGPGTLICKEDQRVEAPVVAGVAFNRDEAQITITGLPDSPGIASCHAETRVGREHRDRHDRARDQPLRQHRPVLHRAPRRLRAGAAPGATRPRVPTPGAASPGTIAWRSFRLSASACARTLVSPRSSSRRWRTQARRYASRLAPRRSRSPC